MIYCILHNVEGFCEPCFGEALARVTPALAPPEWEFFCDESYYDMWAVREIGRWGHCFHLNSHDEAKALCELLNGMTRNPAKPPTPK
jgi:hypothetical protein